MATEFSAGLGAATQFRDLQRIKEKQAFEIQQTQVANFDKIVTDAESSLKQLNEQFAIKRAAAPTGEDQARIDQQYQQAFESVIKPISRAGELANQSGVPIDLPVALSRFVPLRQLSDLNAQALVGARAKGQAQLAEETGKQTAISQTVPLKDAKEFIDAETGQTVFVTPSGEIMETGRQLQKLPAKQQVETTDLTAFQKELGKSQAKQLGERRTAAMDARRALISTAEARKILNEGIVAGFGADFIVGFGKALERAGFNLGDEISNSQAFYAAQATQVANIIQQFGAGTGLSDADREFATKAAAGDISMSESAIRRIIDINERAFRNVITEFNAQVDQIEQGGGTQLPFDIRVEMPPKSKDQIIQEIRNANSIEELQRLEQELNNVR